VEVGVKNRAWVLSCLLLAGCDAPDTDHRTLYAAVLSNTPDQEEKAP
jgi:hypothetical protein